MTTADRDTGRQGEIRFRRQDGTYETCRVWTYADDPDQTPCYHLGGIARTADGVVSVPPSQRGRIRWFD